MLGEILVTKPNGKGIYHNIDGQHRVAAVRLLWGPDEQVPCVVKDAEAVDEKRAAKLFDGINSTQSRTPPNQLETFRVRLTAEEADEVEVDRIVRFYGFRVGYSDKSGRNISACGTLLSILRRYNADILKATLVTVRTTWGFDPAAVNGTMLAGYAMFLREFGHRCDHKRLIRVMEKKYTPGRLLAAIKAMKESNFAPNGPAALVDIILMNYNQRLAADAVLKRK
jgi:hypothetical protein